MSRPIAPRCAAVLPNGSACALPCTGTWCDRHSKQFIPMYKRYKYLESKCIHLDTARPDVNTLTESHCREAIMIASVAYQLRVMMSTQGYHHTLRDEQHEHRIEFLEAYIEWLRSRAVVTVPQSEPVGTHRPGKVRALDHKCPKISRATVPPCAGWGLEEIKSYLTNTIDEHVLRFADALPKQQRNLVDCVATGTALFAQHIHDGSSSKTRWSHMDTVRQSPHHIMRALCNTGMTISSYAFITEIYSSQPLKLFSDDYFDDMCLCCAESRITTTTEGYSMQLLNSTRAPVVIPKTISHFGNVNVHITLDLDMVASMVAPHINPKAWTRAIINIARRHYPKARITQPQCDDPVMTLVLTAVALVARHYNVNIVIPPQYGVMAGASIVVDGRKIHFA